MYTRKYNYILFSLASLFFFFASCSENSVTEPSPENDKPYTITGKIENWIYGDTISLIAGSDLLDSLYTFGSSKVNNDGSFSIDVYTPPKLLQVSYTDEEYTFSDPEAKFVSIVILRLFLPSGTFFKPIYNANALYDSMLTIGTYTIFFEYADRNVTMTGTHQGSNSNGNMIFNYHIIYRKGWNRIKTQLISIEGNNYYFKREVSDTLGGKWFIHEN